MLLLFSHFIGCSPFSSSVNILLCVTRGNSSVALDTHTSTQSGIFHPHSGRIHCTRTEHVYNGICFFCVCSAYVLSTTLGKEALDSIHNAEHDSHDNLIEARVLIQQLQAAHRNEPLMLILKFAGAKKCIQFIALDRISIEGARARDSESVHRTHNNDL